MTMLLLMHFDGANGAQSFVDSSAAGNVFTFSGAAPTLSTAAPKFGSANANLVGVATNYATCGPLPGQAFGTGDFTIQYWQKVNMTQANAGVFIGMTSAVSTGWSVGYDGSGRTAFFAKGGYVTGTPVITDDGNWHAVAWVRNGNVLTCYFDGVGTVASSPFSANFTDTTSPFHIGFVAASGLFQNPTGQIDELRIDNTALYTANYTPATSAFSDSGGPTLSNYFLSPIGNGQTFFYTGTMNPLNAGLINTYAAGTTAPITTYQTNTGTAQSNPIVLTAGGQINGELWFYAGSVVKLVVTDALGNLIQTYDNVYGINDLSGFSNNATSGVEWVSTGLTPTYASSTSFSTPGNTTSTFQTGRRVQATVSAGTVYGTVTSSSYVATTTVNLDMDTSQVLDSGLSAVNVGLLGSTGQNTSVPMSWVNDLTLRNLTATGAITATGGVTGNVTGALTGNASTATNLNTANAAVTLGADWSIDSNGQISNNANNGYIGSYTNTAVISSGTTISMTNSESARGSNFSLSSGNVQTAAAGLYEVVYTFELVNNNSGTYSYNLYFTPSSGTVYGPTSGAPYVAQLNSASIYNSVTLVCLWAANVASNINVTSSVTFTGNNSVANGAQMTIRRVA